MPNLNRVATTAKVWRFCLSGLVLLAAGCSHSGDTEDRGRAFVPVSAPLPPAFLTGPMAVLLTNRAGYSAQVEAQTGSLSERERAVSGQLLCRGDKLFFAPAGSADSKKPARNADFSFIWDVSGNSGYVLSEALQGYAPVGASALVTNLLSAPGQAAPEKIAGLACTPELATAQLNNGSTASFQVLRATALQGLPVRLSSATNAVPLTVTLSKIRLESPPAELFAPPDGFTKYPSPAAMADEIAVRQHNLRRKSVSPVQLPDGLQVTPPQRY